VARLVPYQQICNTMHITSLLLLQTSPRAALKTSRSASNIALARTYRMAPLKIVTRHRL